MRLLYLTDRLNQRGGAPHHLLDVVRSVNGECTLAAGHIAADISLPSNVSIERVRCLSASEDGVPCSPELSLLLDRADVVHVQNVMNPLVLQAATQTGRALVTVQDHRVFCPGPGRTLPNGSRCTTPMAESVCAECLPEAAYRERMLALTAARRDAIAGARLVVLSQYMADELADAGLPGAVVIPPPVRAASAPSQAGHGFLIAGRLVHHKGIDWALAAWRDAQTDHPLMIAGTGALSERLPGAELLGWLDRSALREHMARARALLFPSRWQEPFGISAVEALAEGTPVVCMDTGGTSDWNEAGCVVVPPGDVQAMAEAMARLAAAPDQAARLGAEGWSMVRDRFDPLAAREALWTLYSELT